MVVHRDTRSNTSISMFYFFKFFLHALETLCKVLSGMFSRSTLYEEPGRLLPFEKEVNEDDPAPLTSLSTYWWVNFYFYFCKELEKVLLLSFFHSF